MIFSSIPCFFFLIRWCSGHCRHWHYTLVDALGLAEPSWDEQGSVEHPEKASSWAKPSVTLIWVLSFDCPGKSQHLSWPLSSQQKSTSHTAEARRIRRPQGASAWRFFQPGRSSNLVNFPLKQFLLAPGGLVRNSWSKPPSQTWEQLVDHLCWLFSFQMIQSLNKW